MNLQCYSIYTLSLLCLLIKPIELEQFLYKLNPKLIVEATRMTLS